MVEMQQEDFLSFEILQKFITKRTSKTTAVHNARVIIYDISYMEGIILKESYDLEDTEDEHPVRLMKGRAAYSRKAFNLSDVSLSARYNGPIPLKKEKVQDLKDLLPYIAPMEKQAYLRSVIDGQENATIDLPADDSTEADVDSLENLLFH